MISHSSFNFVLLQSKLLRQISRNFLFGNHKLLRKMHANADDVLSTTTHGEIKGRRCRTIYDDEYFSFERIPYALPPLGELRFREPQAMPDWRPQVLDCTQPAQKPLQKNPMTNEIEGAEDCLYVNAYVKQLKSAKPLPVMVYFYGGGFEKGDPTRNTHAPDYFMMKEVVLFTVAYRVGPLGFLSIHDPAVNVPGNAGLKDQLLALKWIRQNISHFNGDPANVTLFGESAGAAAVHYMMLTPLAKGLFHKAILMSGTVLCPWALQSLPNLPRRLAEAMGLDAPTTKSDQEIFCFLQSAKAEDILCPYVLTKEENINDFIFTFGPVVEPYETANCVVPKQPLELLPGAWGNEIPILIGGTSFEGLLMYARVKIMPFLLEALQKNSELMLPLGLKRDLCERKLMGEKIKKTHFGDKDVSFENVLKYCEYASYKVFWHPILRSIQARLAVPSHAPTYLYRFDFDSPTFNHHRIRYCGTECRGVAHADDLSYLFYSSHSWKLAQDTPEYKTIMRMIDIWTTFSATSQPNSKTTEGLAWKPLKDACNLQCLNISTELQVIELPEKEKLEVWNSLYET